MPRKAPAPRTTNTTTPAVRSRVVPQKQAAPENGKLYWVQIHGIAKPTKWMIALRKDDMWSLIGDTIPWGAVKKYMPGPEIPEVKS